MNLIRILLILVVFVLGVIVLMNQIQKKRQNDIKTLISQSYGIDALLHDLGWKDISYPVIGFGGDTYAIPINVNSLEIYNEEYLGISGGFEVEYIIDASGKKYMLEHVALQSFISTADAEFMVQKLVSTEDKSLTFEALKQKVISAIGQGFDYTLKEVEQATDIQSLAQALESEA